MSHNSWIHRIVRPMVRPLVGTRVAPNHVTTLRLLAGLSAAGAVAIGTAEGLRLGALLFLISFFLDRADGVLARMSGKSSPFGHRYDLIADSVSNALLFVGLGIGLRQTDLGGFAIPMGIIAGLAIISVLWLTIRAEQRDGLRAAEPASFAGFDIDDTMLVVPIAIWLGWSKGLLYAAAIGAPAFAVLFFWKHARYLASGRRAGN